MAKLAYMILFFIAVSAALVVNNTANVCKGNAECFSSTVERIVDGDTLVIGNKTIRLVLVNAPEKGEEGGDEATNFTSSLCPIGSTAIVDEDDKQTKGSYGRTVAVVYCNNKNLNSALLENGFGYIFTEYCDSSEFGREPWAKKYGC
ncbi:MAG: thermonuclease family protein [Candidatus Aenigmatarchaeota archaeon]